MYCKHCGKKIDDDSKFCQYCGGILYLDTSKIVPKPKNDDDTVNATNVDNSKESPKIEPFSNLINNSSFTSVISKNPMADSCKNSEDGIVYTTTESSIKHESHIDAKSDKPFISPTTSVEKKEAVPSKESSVKPSVEGKKEETKSNPSNIKYDFGAYDDSYHEEGLWGKISKPFLDALLIVGIILFFIFAILLCLIYLRVVVLGWVLSIAAGPLVFFLVRKCKRWKENKKTKQENDILYYIRVLLFTLLLLFICFLALREYIVKSINEPSQTTLEKGNQPSLDNNDHTSKAGYKLLNDYKIKQKKAELERRYNKRLKEIQSSSPVVITDEMKQQIQDLPSEND